MDWEGQLEQAAKCKAEKKEFNKILIIVFRKKMYELVLNNQLFKSKVTDKFHQI